MMDRKQRILDVAMALADQKGLAAVSMRAVAKRVGVTPMALYGHVAGKEALLDGLMGRLLTELLPCVADLPAEDWQARLRALARGVRTLAKRHPSAFSILMARPPVTPDAVRVVDLIYSALIEAGVPPPHVLRLERMFSTFAMGYATSEVAGRFGAGTRDPPDRRAQFPPNEIPGHRRLARWLDRTTDWDAEFEADLDDLLSILDAYRKG
jgi:AcrR family transcriptional regulator